MLVFIILYFDFFYKQKNLIDTPEINTTSKNTNIKDLFYNVNTNGSSDDSQEAAETSYQPPTLSNPANNSLFITEEDKAKYRMSRTIFDSNEASLVNTNGSPNFILPQSNSNIKQFKSTLYDDAIINSNNANNSNSNSNYVNVNPNANPNANNITTENYDTVGNYATLDSLGRGLTDTLGGIHTEMGYTILEEQLGTFKKEPIINPHTYDNTTNYNAGMDPKTVDGVTTVGATGKFSQDNKPVFLQKDFDGVANIFAPNIIIQNPPLSSDGYPDITFDM